MSKRNSQAAKTAARERLRAEREREAKRAKARRQIIVALSVVGVLAAAGGVGYAIVQANKPDGWEAAKNAKLVKPAHSTGKDGTTVVIGKDSAKKTLVMYEDPRCPACAQFEQTVGSTVDKTSRTASTRSSSSVRRSSTTTCREWAPRTRSARWAPP